MWGLAACLGQHSGHTKHLHGLWCAVHVPSPRYRSRGPERHRRVKKGGKGINAKAVDPEHNNLLPDDQINEL